MTSSTTSNNNKTLTKEQAELFTEGVALVFEQWTAVQLILAMQPLGLETNTAITELSENVAEWLIDEGMELDFTTHDLATYMEEVFSQDLHTDVEDSSAYEVAKLLQAWLAACLQNDFAMLAQWKQIKASGEHSKALQKSQQEELTELLMRNIDIKDLEPSKSEKKKQAQQDKKMQAIKALHQLSDDDDDDEQDEKGAKKSSNNADDQNENDDDDDGEWTTV